MKQIIIIGDPDRVDAGLLQNLQRLFPECDIKVVSRSGAGPFRPTSVPHDRMNSIDMGLGHPLIRYPKPHRNKI